jgi:hypothetical protein
VVGMSQWAKLGTTLEVVSLRQTALTRFLSEQYSDALRASPPGTQAHEAGTHTIHLSFEAAPFLAERHDNALLQMADALRSNLQLAGIEGSIGKQMQILIASSEGAIVGKNLTFTIGARVVYLYHP